MFSIDAYRRLRTTPGYDAELDIVIESGGRLVSYCVGWTDPASGVGYFEPVGTRPSSAGLGYGRAALHEGLRRMRERGLHTAMVATASINTAAQALYPSAGFRVVDEEHFYTKSFA